MVSIKRPVPVWLVSPGMNFCPGVQGKYMRYKMGYMLLYLIKNMCY